MLTTSRRSPFTRAQKGLEPVLCTQALERDGEALGEMESTLRDPEGHLLKATADKQPTAASNLWIIEK